MNNCVGFPNGTVANSFTTQTNTSSAFTSTTARAGLIAIYANNNDRLYFTNSGGILCNIQIPASLVYSGTSLAAAMNPLFATALAGNNCNITVAFSTVTNLFTFTDNTTSNTFTLLSANSTCLAAMGISQVDHVSTPSFINSTCTLVTPQIIDLSGNNGFYFTTNLATGNYNFVTLAGGSGSNRKNTINK